MAINLKRSLMSIELDGKQIYLLVRTLWLKVDFPFYQSTNIPTIDRKWDRKKMFCMKMAINIL